MKVSSLIKNVTIIFINSILTSISNCKKAYLVDNVTITFLNINFYLQDTEVLEPMEVTESLVVLAICLIAQHAGTYLCC